MKILVFVAGVVVGAIASPIGIRLADEAWKPASEATSATAPMAAGMDLLRAALISEEGRLFEQAKKAVSENLFDPYSAVFSDLRLVSAADGKRVCGYVNAKNKMGGFVGRSPFTFDPSIKLAYVIDDKKSAFIAGAENIRPCFPSYRIPATAIEAQGFD